MQGAGAYGTETERTHHVLYTRQHTQLNGPSMRTPTWALGPQLGTQPGQDLIAIGLVGEHVRGHLAGSAGNHQVLYTRHVLELDEDGPQLHAAREMHGCVAVCANGQHVAAPGKAPQHSETRLVHSGVDRNHATVARGVLEVEQDGVAMLLHGVGDLRAAIAGLHAE